MQTGTRALRRARWATAVGCLGALGYGGLSVLWAAGVTVGIDAPELVRPASSPALLWILENLGTAVVAAIAATLLVVLARPGAAPRRRPMLRVLGWLGAAVWLLAGAVGLAGSAAHLAAGGGAMGGVSAWTYVFIDCCYLLVGIGFAGTSVHSAH